MNLDKSIPPNASRDIFGRYSRDIKPLLLVSIALLDTLTPFYADQRLIDAPHVVDLGDQDLNASWQFLLDTRLHDTRRKCFRSIFSEAQDAHLRALILQANEQSRLRSRTKTTCRKVRVNGYRVPSRAQLWAVIHHQVHDVSQLCTSGGTHDIVHSDEWCQYGSAKMADAHPDTNLSLLRTSYVNNTT